MSEINVLPAVARDRAGKGAARAERRAGRVPAVVYGDKKDPVMISMDPRVVIKNLDTGSFFSTVYDLEVDGKRTDRVLARDIQLHPVTDRPLHIDFLRVSGDAKLAVNVAVNFINEEECIGLKKGGILNIVRHDVELLCSIDNIPQQLECDIISYDIGDSIHISAISLPEGVTPTITDRDFTVATIAAPIVKEEEEAVAAEGAEGEGEEGAPTAEGAAPGEEDAAKEE